MTETVYKDWPVIVYKAEWIAVECLCENSVAINNRKIAEARSTAIFCMKNSIHLALKGGNFLERSVSLIPVISDTMLPIILESQFHTQPQYNKIHMFYLWPP